MEFMLNRLESRAFGCFTSYWAEKRRMVYRPILRWPLVVQSDEHGVA